MKLVNESLFEFQKGLDPVESLGLGKRAQIKEWLDSYNIKNYIINNDYTIDVDDNVILSGRDLNKLPKFIQFGHVGYDFFISDSELTTLKGCPTSVKGDFLCSRNKLTSLKYLPKIINGDLYCKNNKISFTYEDIKNVSVVKGRVWL